MLTGVTRGTKKPPRVVLYGPPKIGKSTFGSEAPDAVFVTTEDGIDNVTVDRFPRAESWAALIDNLEQVAKGEHSYKTLVLDTLNGAAELAAQHTCITKFSGDWGPKGFAAFGQGQAATSEEMRRVIPIFDACRARGMVVLLLAHTGVQSVRNPIEGDFTKYTPDVDRRVWARFAAWADIIMRADYEYFVKKSDNPLAKGKAVGTSTRVLRCSGSAAEDVGTRVGFELPSETLPLSWQAFADALGQDTSTLDEVKRLWTLLDKSTQAKTMAWLGVKALDDAKTTQLRGLLNRLRKLEAEQAAPEKTEESHAA
jgi:hypothetical protein